MNKLKNIGYEVPEKRQPELKEEVHENWTTIISPRKSLFDLNLREVWRYRDLLLLFVRRNIVAEYKQTILGPIWYFIQPLLTTIMFTVIFGRLAGISTDSIPPMLFYLAGITNWNYFAESLNKTATTFKDNQNIFGKVYFPRLVVPLSIIITNLLKYGIQLTLFIGFYVYFLIQGVAIQPNATALLFPLLVIILAGLGLGFGLIVTSMTTKYRDLVFLLSFGVQLAMYATPVIYPLSEIPAQYQWLSVLNPMTAVIETFKYGFLGKGTFEWAYLGYSLGFMVAILLGGIAVFNRTEKNFMDTV
ncbi:MAG: ABC transporter permease [Lewinellaceae bacterium]|nr:ABC transporter permease [Phaeodactylibacter sp.]MCB9036065.1 ABC transporter permease [Lewinellaceae bacterium]